MKVYVADYKARKEYRARVRAKMVTNLVALGLTANDADKLIKTAEYTRRGRKQ